MHEIMHALGLKHTFTEGEEGDLGKKHVFKLKSSTNYMDYKKRKEFTWKWQWEKLHNYSHLK